MAFFLCYFSLSNLQSGVCTDDEDCGGDEFCNDARGACLPCRKSRKRCARDSMCCAGNRCSNGKERHLIWSKDWHLRSTKWQMILCYLKYFGCFLIVLYHWIFFVIFVIDCLLIAWIPLILLTFLGVCQANDIDGTDASIITGWHKHNTTMEHHTKKPPASHGHQPHAVKGEFPVKSHLPLLNQSNQARSFSWAQFNESLVPVLSHFVQAWRGTPVWDRQTALRVCAAPDTSGLASVSLCWPRARCVRATAGKAPMAWSFSSAAIVETAWPADQKKESETTVSAGLRPGTYTPVRNADTKCMDIHTHTHTPSKPTNQSQTLTNPVQPCIHLRCWQTHIDTQHQRHSFLPKLLTQTAPGRIDVIPGKTIHPEGCSIVSRTDPILHQQMRNRKFRKWHFKSLGKIDLCCRNGRAVLFLFLWNLKPQLLQ